MSTLLIDVQLDCPSLPEKASHIALKNPTCRVGAPTLDMYP